MAGALASLSPDVIVLTEYVPGISHNRFILDLESQDFPYWVLSQPTPGHNHIFIASRTALEAGKIRAPPIAPAFPSNVLHVHVPQKGFEVLGLRIPVTLPAPIHHACWNWIMETAHEIGKRPSIILGDFNNDTETTGPDGGIRFRQFKDEGWQHALPISGNSFWSKKGRESRLDHALLSRHFAIRNAEYITESGKYVFAKKSGAMSDHAVLLVDADLKLTE